jgi:glycosyltransferase involved in cell wall biosynthesis
MKVGIIIPTLADGDAVGHDAIGMAKHIRGRGIPVSFFVTRSTSAEPTHLIDDLPAAFTSPDDVLIYHHSIGFEPGVRAIERLPARRKAVKYHNVTPPQFFKGLNAEVSRACVDGIAQVKRLADTPAKIWADSEYNGEHMRSFRPGRAYDVIPPFHHADDLLTLEPDYRAVSGLDDWATTILLVGRIVPNKNVPLAIAAFADYRRRFDKHARLVIAGDQPVPEHSKEVRESVSRLGQDGHVFVTGKVSTAQLKALYLTADVLLVTSLHEGFCVPLIEAMGLRVPVVAVPNAAVPYTGGDVPWYADGEPTNLAAQIDAVLTDPAEREKQTHAGWRRYDDTFTNRAIEERFAGLFDELLAG